MLFQTIYAKKTDFFRHLTLNITFDCFQNFNTLFIINDAKVRKQTQLTFAKVKVSKWKW